MRPILMLALLLTACGGGDATNPAPPTLTYPASMVVALDSTVDSAEVRAADSLIVVRAGETSRCVKWQLASPAQRITMQVWDGGAYIGEAGWTWSVEQFPHVRGRAWYDGSRYLARFDPVPTACGEVPSVP